MPTFNSQLKTKQIPIKDIVVETSATAPSTPVNGQLYYDTALLRMYVRENGAWVLGSLTGAELLANKGATNGYAALVSGTVPIAQVPTGTSSTTVALGNDSRLSDQRVPTDASVTGGTAGTGVKIAATTITAANIVNATITDVQIAAANKDGAAGTVSLRTLGTGAAQAAAGNDSRLSDTRVPTDNTVTGGTTGAGVKIAALTITAANIANGTITDVQVATANKDGVAGTASLRTLGTGAQQAAAGNDSRFTDTRTPTANSITSAMIIDGAITDADVNAANKDGVVGTASLRTIGTGAQQAMAGSTRLDTIAAPTGTVSLNSQRIINVADPTGPQDAATKAYVDATAVGLDVKGSVRLASTANVTVTYTATAGTSGRGQITAAPNTLDSVTLVAGNRILLKDQSTGAQNGIWVVTTLGTGANGVWDRATDFDTDPEVTAGAFVFVEEGTINGDGGFTLTTNNPIVIGGASGTALSWAQFSGAGAVTGGAGIVKTGSVLDVVGTANRISVLADSVDIDAAYVGQTSITTLGTVATGTWSGTTIALNKGGTGATTAAAARTALGAVGKYAADIAALSAGVELNVVHSLGTLDVQVQTRLNSTGGMEEFDIRVIDTNTVGVTSALAYAANLYRIVVIG